MQKAMVFTSFTSLISSELALIWWAYIQELGVYYDGTSDLNQDGPFLFLEQDETVMSKLIWLVQYAYFYFLVTGLTTKYTA